MLSRPGEWVWDTWFADDGERYHAFHLYATQSLSDERRRHRWARIGHAVSDDLVSWTLLRDPFGLGGSGAFDQTATWTGSVVRGDDGQWRMFYTGARFVGAEPDYHNVQRVGVATSDDLVGWVKRPDPVVSADPRWYEQLGDSLWVEEAWRDPFVFADPAGDGWHMLVCARSNDGPIDDRGVIGHAVSDDLHTWRVLPPLSAPGAGFGHLEVPQLVQVDGRWVLLFSCGHGSLSTAHAARRPTGGVWALAVDDPTGPFDVAAARLLAPEDRYAGHLVATRDGGWALMAFVNRHGGGPFAGYLADPVPVRLDESGHPVLGAPGAPDLKTPGLRPLRPGRHRTEHRRPDQGVAASSTRDPALDKSSIVGCSTRGES